MPATAPTVLGKDFTAISEVANSVAIAIIMKVAEIKICRAHERNIVINHPLYFAKKSKSWDSGGVGFIGLSRNDHEQTYGRMYLITRSQFADVVKQETKSKHQVSINFESAIEKGHSNVLNDSWYGNILHIGTEGGYPIFTFTNSSNLSDYNKPSVSYLKTIIKGVLVNHKMSENEMLQYLQSRPGILDNYSEEELMVIIDECNEEICHVNSY